MIDKYAVFGNPISHSQSPFIHQEFAKQTGQTLSYQALLSPLDGLKKQLTQFFANGGKGANITVPFKEQVIDFCDELSDEARVAGAVNTLILLNNGTIRGDNTDGFGLVTDLQTHLGSLAGKSVLLLGAGGAARGSILPLCQSGIGSLTIHNRTHDKAVALAREFANLEVVDAKNNDELNSSYQLIINATSANLSSQMPNVPAVVIDKHSCCYDMMYGKTQTAFHLWAQQNGATISIDGLGMLVAQAAKSFTLWRGVTPKIAPVLAELRRRNQA